jgi:tetrapyrrole methylase family protein/MazG family protein
MAPGITVIGLGPGDPNQITLEAQSALSGASEVYLRTKRHPSVDSLMQGRSYRSFDDVYEQLETFEEVYQEIARRVVELGERPQGVVYAVPGHPLVGERTVLLLLDLTRERGLPIRIVAGVSFLEPTLTALGIDPFDGLQICDATALAQKHHPNLDPDVGALIVQVYSRHVAADVKMTLTNLYHDTQPITLVRHAGTAEQALDEMPLYMLDRRDDLDHLTSLYIPPLPQPGSLSSYQDILARLRAPGGCPWDREQTHQSLRAYLLEEAYELLEALDADDIDKVEEELGDLLLQILFHAQIASEGEEFKLIDVVQRSIEKLVRRHPHVFASASAENAEDVLRTWEQIKREERADASVSMLAGINKALPALSQAMDMQRRVARVGFDWPSAEPVAEKVAEEIDEFLQAPDAESRTAEMGDILFSLVNLSRWHGIDPESALREADQRFARRFAFVERHAAKAEKPLEEMTPEEMDQLWERAKREERDR